METMNMKKKSKGQSRVAGFVALSVCCFVTFVMVGCMSAKHASSSGKGGEVVGVGGRTFSEPTPYGMTNIGRGWLRMGIDEQDTLWGKKTPVRDVSVMVSGWMKPVSYTHLTLPTKA